MLGNVSPDREFRILGPDPRYEIIVARTRDLREDLSEVTGIMLENYPKYQKRVNLAISEAENTKGLYLARKYSMELKMKLKRLQ